MVKGNITKLIRIIAVIFSITGISLSQDILWQRVFDTGETDYVEGIATDSQGNIIVTGRSSREYSGGDCLTIKYNPDGDTLWTQWYDSTFYNGVNAVTSDCSDNIIIVGYIWTDSTNADICIVKYDSVGNLLWVKTYGNGEKDVGESGYGVVTDSQNNIIVIAKADYNFGDYLTLKYDSSGNLLWSRTYDGGGEDYAKDITVDNSDNVIITGYSYRSHNDWGWCTIKYSPDGETDWIKRYNGTSPYGSGITTDPDGNIIVVGDKIRLLPGTGGCSGTVVKYSPEGDTLWTKIFTDTLQHAEVATFADVITDDYGNIYLAGEYARWNDIGQLWIDYHIAKCTSFCDTIWTKFCSYGGRNEACGIALDKWGNIIITGSTYPGPEDSDQQDYFTIKIQNGVNSIEESSSVPHYFQLSQNYPNPFNATTTIRYDNPETALVKIILYDLHGRSIAVLINEYKRQGVYEVVWNAANFSSGVYFARMTAGDYNATRKMLLIK